MHVQVVRCCDHQSMEIIRQPYMICLTYAALLSLHILVIKNIRSATTTNAATFVLYILRTVIAVMMLYKASLVH